MPRVYSQRRVRGRFLILAGSCVAGALVLTEFASSGGRARADQWADIRAQVPPASEPAAPASEAATASESASADTQPPETQEEARERRRRELEEIRQRAEARRRAATQPAATQPVVTTQPPVVESAPAEPPAQPPPEVDRPAAPPPAEDGRTEWFSFHEAQWEDVIEHFARRLGKPLIGDPMIGGTLTYKGQRKMTKEEALDELNLLMQMQGYRFVELETYVMVVPLSEMPQHVPVERVYPTVEEFERASLRNMEYATVYMRVTDRPAEQVVELFGDRMPDYARFSALPETNQVKITAVARDIRDFLRLYRLLPFDPSDPRKMRVFPIKTNAAVMESMIRSLLNVQQGPQRRFNPQTRRVEIVPESQDDIRILADDRTNTLIVKGTEAELKRVEEFLNELDKKVDIGEFKTNVIEIRFGNASEIARLLNDIFQQEQGQQPVAQRFRQPTRTPPRPGQPQPNQPQPGQPLPQDIFVEDIFERARKTVRLVADDRTNTLIVYANKDGLQRVRDMLDVIDRPVPSNFRTFTLRHADAQQLQPTIEQIARGVATPPGGGRPARNTTVLADAAANAIHVIADREVMSEIERILTQLDVPGAREQQHVIELVNTRPSEMVPVVEQLLRSSAGPRAAARRGRPGAPGGPVVGTQVMALDSARLLVVLCTDDEWTRIESTIRTWDERAVSSTERLEVFRLQKGDAATIADTLTQIFRVYNHPTLGRSQPVITPDRDAIYVYAVQPAIEEIGALIAAMDVEPQVNPLVILPLAHADATQVAQQVAPLLAGAAGGPRGPRAPRGAAGAPGTCVPDPVTNSLIIRADEETLDQITDFARKMDEAVAAQTPERRFYTLRFADPREVVAAVQALFAAGGGRMGGRAVGGGAAQVKAVTSGRQIVIDAPLEKFAEIEKVIAELDDPQGKEIVIKTVRMPGADVQGHAGRLTNAFREKQRQGMVARFEADLSTETILVTCSADLLPEVEKLLAEIKEQTVELVDDTQFRTLRYAAAAEAAPWLQQQLVTIFTSQSRNVASRIRVTADSRTNRVIISGPSVAVKTGMQLLEQYDVEAESDLSDIGNVATEMRKLPGLNVGSLAGMLNQAFAGRQRPDRLRFTFGADQLTETLIMTVPKDTLAEVDGLIAKFAAEIAELDAVEKFFEIRNAEAAYVAEQLRNLLVPEVRNKRGADVANRVTIGVDTRMNRVVLNVPKFALERAEALIAELDRVGPDLAPVVLTLQHADPQQIAALINSMYGQGRSQRQGGVQQPVQATVSNNTLVVRAPARQIEEIKQLVAQVDAVDTGGIEVRTYPLKVLNAQQVAAQVNLFLAASGVAVKAGQLKPGAFGEPVTNTLVVLAPKDQVAFIDGLVAKFESTGIPSADARSYVLQRARADLVAPTVDTMLKAKVREREGGNKQQTIQTAVVSDQQGNRVFVYAPADYQELAAELIRMIDQEVDSGELVHLVPLERADAAQLAQTLNQTIQQSRGGRQARVVADVGSNSLLISGLPGDVQWVERLIADLEISSASVPELQIFQLEHAASADVVAALQGIFGAARSPADIVTVTEDEYYNRLIVSASRRKMRQVEGYVKLLDAPPVTDLAAGGVAGGKQLYFVDVYRGDAFDIAYDVQDMLPPEDKGGPRLDPDWDGEYIKVLCRPNEIDNIIRLIREFDDRAKPDVKVTILKPRNLDRALQYLPGKVTNLQIEQVRPAAGQRESIIVDLWGDDEAPPGARPRSAVPETPERSEPREPPPATQPRERPRRDARAAPAAQIVLAAWQSADAQGEPSASGPARPSRREAERKREPARVQVLPDGRVIVSGPTSSVKDIEDAIKLLEEDLAVGEVIRIFRFKYGDVTAAASVLDKMFNEPVLRMPIPPQQPQQPQQPPRGREGRGEGEREGERGQPGGLMEQLRSMIGARGQPGAPPGAAASGGRQLRIATDPGHNYLIVKCEESLLPDIIKLLRELDIPPSDVDVRVFQLRNLDAQETASNIKEVLGITRARQPRGLPQVPRGGPQQQQLLQILQEQLAVALPGVEGEAARIESVEIVANAVTNSLLVSAPPEVMKIVETVITELEGLEGREVLVVKHYELKKARVDDLLPLLQDVFESAGRAEGRGRPGGRGSPADLGPVSIAGDPRSNTLIVTAQAKDIPVVEQQIEKLDIAGAIAEADTYVCKYGDAEQIARAVEAIYGTGDAAARRGAGARGGPGGAGQEVRITAEPATNTIIVLAPEDRRNLILARIRQLDELNPREIREIPLINADPEKLAERLMMIFGGRVVTAAAGPRGPRGPGAGPQAASERVLIIGDKNANKLLVRAPQDIFQQIKELVATLDVPTEQLQVRHYPLRFADAQTIVDSVKSAMLEFMTVMRQTGGTAEIDPFTAVADPRTNSVVVVGSTETFLFVEQVLSVIDVPTPEQARKQFRVFALQNADAQTVADAINGVALGTGPGDAAARTGRPRPGMPAGRMPGFPGGGGAARSARGELDVVAAADPVVNAVMVFGRPEDIERVEREIIQHLEDAGLRRVTRIPVEHASPTQVANYVAQFWAGARDGQSAPQIQANEAGKAIIVFGTSAEIAKATELVRQFDDTTIGDIRPVRVIALAPGQDGTQLAREVERVVNEGERNIAAAQGRQPRLVSIASSPLGDALIVYGDPTSYAMVEGVVHQLSELGPSRMVTRVIQLTNLSADDAQAIINELQQRRGGTSGGPAIRPAGTPGGAPGGRGFTLPPGGRQPPQQPQRPQGGQRGGRPQPRGGGGSGGGAWLTPSAERAPGMPGRTPVIATTPLWPALLGTMLCQSAQESPQPPADGQTTQPVSVTPGITGELRGPVVAVPLDSRQLVLTGDERDIEFLTRMLSLMEGTAPAPEIRVFTLQNAKATALQQPLQQTVQALIQQLTQRPGRGDQFSIIAEARSNSLIVAASKTNMEMIAQIIEKLDYGTEVPSQFKTVPLFSVQAGEAVSILRPIIERLNRLRGTPAEAQAAIEPVDRANSVLIIGTPTDIVEIESLLSEIDVELDPEQERSSFTIADVMVINLENAVAEDLAGVLQELIQTDRAAAGGGPGAQGAAGRRSAAQLIRQLRLRTPEGRELPKLDLDKPIVIRAEKGTNSLIVFSSTKNNQALREIVSLFDALPRGAEVDVKAIVVQHASAAALAEILQNVFDEGKAALRRPAEGSGQGLERGVMPPMPPGVAGRGLPFNVAVSFDERSNTVVVIGRKDAVLLAAGLITQLDKPGADLNYRPFVINLKNMPAAELQTRLQEMLDKRAQALGGERNAARDSAVLVADDRTNSLVMLASPDVYEMVSKLAAQLDGAGSYRVVDSRFRRLRHADAAKLQGLLQDLFDKKKQAEADLSKSKDVVHVLADARSNALMLTGTRDYLEEAERLISSLDQPFEPTVEFRVRPVLLNSASNIATLITEMVEKTRNVQDARTRGTPIHVAADPYSNNLLIAAASEDLNMVERWIEVLDRPAEPGRVVRIIPVRRQKAEELARQAQEIFGRSGGGAAGAGTPDLSVAHDPVTNSVVAIGPPAVVKDIEETIRQLEEITPGANTVLKHFKLEQADAQDAGNLLRNILALQSGSVGGTRGTGGAGGTAAQEEAAKAVMLIYQRQHPESGVETLRALRTSVTVIDDIRTNSLYIMAPPEAMPLMESLVAAVDIPPDAAKVRVFALRNSTAEEMVRTLEALFSGQSVQRSGGTGAGAGDQQERVLTLGEGLAEGGRQQLTFTTDTRTNSVIAAGTKGYLDLVEELIIQLDSQPIEERKTLVYEPRNILPQAMQESLKGYNDAEQQILSEMREEISVSRRLERQILAVSNEDAKKVIISYDPRREADVLDLVRELDQPPPQVMIQVLIIEVGLDNSLELGVEFAYQDLQFTKAGPNDTTTFDYVVGTDIGAGGAGLGGFTFTISGKDFSFLLRALQSEGNLTVLSRPQIIAMDNQQAVIDISNDVPYVTGTSTTTGGQITTSVSREKVGIRLEVTPQINPDGYVRMEITQEVSDLTDSTVPVAPGVNAPIFFTRELTTVVTVRDNETVVLGGLITSRDSTTENKIPLVGDIPILGRLFTYTNNQAERRELLLVLTPRVVRTPEDYRELSIQERDRTGMIPRDVLTHPLMNGLRVSPEDLPAAETGRELGPFPAEDQTLPAGPSEDEYGPQPGGRPGQAPPAEDSSSYDVPITRRTGAPAGRG